MSRAPSVLALVPKDDLYFGGICRCGAPLWCSLFLDEGYCGDCKRLFSQCLCTDEQP